MEDIAKGTHFIQLNQPYGQQLKQLIEYLFLSEKLHHLHILKDLFTLSKSLWLNLPHVSIY